MGNKLVPGDLKPVSETSSDDYSKFVNSMAAEMEKELNDLMVQGTMRNCRTFGFNGKGGKYERG